MLALLAVFALQGQAADAARAESLLAAGALRDARAIAERLVARTPRDARAHDLLGRVWFAWPVVGRYQALAEFKAAARLAPLDPEPLYHQMQVGFYLGSDEGEVMAREAILGILAIDPEYRDAWDRFQELYHNRSIWRKADAALARHADRPVVLERRAGLAIALEEPARAESLAARAAAAGSPTSALFLLRAEAAFLAGRDEAGQALHDSAVAHANADTSEALWARARLIASPEEVARYHRTEPGGRRTFFEAFWGTRDPNLVTRENERLAEQTRRLAEARRQFRLLHPQRMVYRSSEARALAWFAQRRQFMEHAAEQPGLGGRGLANPSAAVMRAALLDFQDFQDTAAVLAYRAGLDARGLTYVRYGRPDTRVPCSPDPLYYIAEEGCIGVSGSEGWVYQTANGPVAVGFKSEEYFWPVSEGLLHSAQHLMRTDRTALPAPLAASGNAAFFKGVRTGHSDLYFRVPGDTAALVLWDGDGGEVARAAGAGLLAVEVPAGGYRFGLDIDSGGVLGRARDRIVVPWFNPDELTLSSLVVAPDSAAAGRAAVLRAMPADLGFAAGAPLAAYAEVYGLVADATGRVRYRARYTFAPVRSLVGRVLRGTDPVSFEFERVAPGDVLVTERLLLAPGRVPPGRYRVTLAVTDVARNVKSETVAIVVTIH